MKTKQKLSQTHIKNLNKFQQKMQQLTKIQGQMYQRIMQNQKHTLSQIQQSKQNRKKCLKERPTNIKAQTFQQIVKHPANGNQRGGNGCWMYLANFIQESHDLSEVELRMIERKRVRDQIEQRKQDQKDKQEQRVRKQKEDRQFQERMLTGKGFSRDNKSRKGTDSLSFNLQRQLRKAEVQENKKRLQKMKEYKRQTYYRNNL